MAFVIEHTTSEFCLLHNVRIHEHTGDADSVAQKAPMSVSWLCAEDKMLNASFRRRGEVREQVQHIQHQHVFLEPVTSKLRWSVIPKEKLALNEIMDLLE